MSEPGRGLVAVEKLNVEHGPIQESGEGEEHPNGLEDDEKGKDLQNPLPDAAGDSPWSLFGPFHGHPP
jgi:hypothetical protein